MTDTVLIVGGYGVFGSRLARRLARRLGEGVVIAGRNLTEARVLATELGCKAARLDTDADDLEQRIAEIGPGIIIDAAGPFQAYGDHGYRLARIAVDLGAHYLDLSDDGAFTAGISVLDEDARKAGVTVLSGVSSVPALSSVITRHLARGIEDIHEIEATILPGNRAPRGESVMRSILSQVGRPLRLWHGGEWSTRPAWCDLQPVDLHVAGHKPIKGRRASLIGAPDLTLFPKAFKARSVSFRAGLELPIMQYGLWLLHWLPRLGLLRSLVGLTRPLKWLADRLERFGTDRGGMRVQVRGQTETGALIARTWTLIVEQGDGPFIPGLAAEILTGKLLAGTPAPGARACLAEFSTDEFEAVAADLNIVTGETQRPVDPVFEQVLEDGFDDLPAELKELHTVLSQRRWRGEASVERGSSWMSRIAGWLAGFPPAADAVAVDVTMSRTARGETWTRQFGRRRFRSYLSARKQRSETVLIERFGLMAFVIGLTSDGGKLCYPVRAGRLLGVPLPAFLRPSSDTHEYVDAQGRACFSVRVSLPIAGLVAKYEGWLAPV